MILVDSSIWINHVRLAVPLLEELIAQGEVLTHPFVIGELAMGSLKDRDAMIRELSELPTAQIADDEEVLALVKRFKIYSRGIGYIDAHLLASVRLTRRASLWTRDRRFLAIAEELHIATKLPGMFLQ